MIAALNPISESEELAVAKLSVLLLFCVFVITVMALYIPIVHIRLSNKVLKKLDEIEANTRK
jgi:hypothetical protein